MGSRGGSSWRSWLRNDQWNEQFAQVGADNQTLKICLRLRIPVISVYAFAIDNFNRPQEEVDALMSLARSSLAEICQNG